MEDPRLPDYGDADWMGAAPPVRRRGGRRWLLISALAAAFALALGVGAYLGSSYFGTAQAAGANFGNTAYSQRILRAAGQRAVRPGVLRQCAGSPGAL